MKLRLHFLLLCIPFLGFAQTTVTLNPTQDNTLYEDANGSVSNGSGVYVFSGLTNQNEIRRALVQFDLSSIPSNAIVQSVSLAMTVNKTKSGAHQMKVHRVNSSWGEGSSNAGSPGGQGTAAATNDATWLHRFFSTQNWNNAGGDYQTTASANNLVASVGTYTWSSAGLISDVQFWLSNPSQNHGFILIGDENTAQSASRFASRESATSKPALSITYTMPCVEPDLPSLSFATDSICEGDSTWMYVTGNLNAATQWHVYDGTCGGSALGTTLDSIFVPVNGDLFVRGEGGCTSPGACQSGAPVIRARQDPFFSYFSNNLCVDGSQIQPDSISYPFGVFSSPTLSILPGNGAFTLDAAAIGTHVITYTINGDCPSISHVTLNINPTYSDSVQVDLCVGDSIFFEGAWQKQDGIFHDTLSSQFGCDSVSIVNLNFLNSIQSFQSYFICDGDSILIEGTYQHNASTYVDTLTSVIGCDSVVYSTLTVNPQDTADISYPGYHFCQSDSLVQVINNSNNSGTFNVSPSVGLALDPNTGEINFAQSAEGVYTILFLTSGICWDTSMVSVSVHAAVAFADTVRLCPGEVYFLGGQLLDSAGDYRETLQTIYGCDSLVDLNLTYELIDTSVTLSATTNLLSGTSNESAADSYIWFSCDSSFFSPAFPPNNNATYNPIQTGNYAVVIEKNGCYDTSACYYLTNTVGIEEGLGEVKIYPNPATSFLFIENSMLAETYVIRDLLGAMVQSGNLNKRSNPRLDLGSLKPGMYFIELQADEQLFLAKFLVE